MRDQAQRQDGDPRSNPIIDAVTHSNLHTYLSGEVWLFLLFSIADVVLTFKLLYHGGHFESNPIARFFLAHWGPKGMVYFKFAMVSLVFVIVQVIAYKHIETARRILNFAIVAVGGVVTYSAILYLRAAA